MGGGGGNFARRLRRCSEACGCGPYPATSEGKYETGYGLEAHNSTIVAPVGRDARAVERGEPLRPGLPTHAPPNKNCGEAAWDCTVGARISSASPFKGQVPLRDV